MPKIYLSPAYHKWNPCAIAGCDETTHNNAYLDELEVYLKACGIEYKRGTKRVPKSSENGTTLMENAIKESNSWKPDIHYISHTNASNGTVRGYRPMIYPTNNPKGEKLAEILTKYRREIYNSPIIIKRTDEWAELRETVAVAYYEEHVFHDNTEDAQWFHDNMRLIAKQTCRGFCEYFDIPFVDPYEAKEELYRVRKSFEDADSQVGAYTILQNAIAKAQSVGLNVYNSSGELEWEYIPEKEPESEPPKEDTTEDEKEPETEEKSEITAPDNTVQDTLADEIKQSSGIISAFIRFIIRIFEMIKKK